MPRLFVAVDLPGGLTEELACLQPPRAPRVRLVRPNQMHLTVHYLGEANIERTATALRAVAVGRFPLVIEGVGLFPSPGGAVTLWAGVRESPELLGLHAAVAAALAGTGFRPEARPYAAHVTLARCAPGARANVAADFLAQCVGFSLPAVTVESFGLYSSALVGGAPVYQQERCYPLRASGGGP